MKNKQLYKAVFWFKNLEKINDELLFKIPCDNDGNVLDPTLVLNAKSGRTYNHKKLWNSLDKALTNNKEFDYYPRGRVEINNNGNVRIFINPNLNKDYIVDYLKNELNLIKENGINEINIINDCSDHYKCYLDR